MTSPNYPVEPGPNGTDPSQGRPSHSSRQSTDSSNDLYGEFVGTGPNTDGGSAPIELESTSVFYGEVIGLSKVDLRIHGGITGIVGPNGSGKSTLMRTLIGLISPSEGTARVLGCDPFHDATIRRRISFVPATECFHDNLSGRRNLEIAFLSHGYSSRESKARASDALETVGMTTDGDRVYRTWSRGMRQRLKLGLALASPSEVVLLDEPFLGVDPPSRKHLRDLIETLGASGRTVLVSSHVLHEIEALTKRVGILAHGRLLGFGMVDRILNELRDSHPHRIRLRSDRPRDLAAALMGHDHVQEIKLVDHDKIEFVTDRPESAYTELGQLVVDTGILIRSVETMDNSLDAVFRHVTESGAHRL